MKKAIAIIVSTLAIAGCGKVDQQLSALTGEGTKTCVDGVAYLQFTSGASVAYTPEGKIKTCN